MRPLFRDGVSARTAEDVSVDVSFAAYLAPSGALHTIVDIEVCARTNEAQATAKKAMVDAIAVVIETTGGVARALPNDDEECTIDAFSFARSEADAVRRAVADCDELWNALRRWLPALAQYQGRGHRRTGRGRYRA
jgi:hypothetical protein